MLQLCICRWSELCISLKPRNLVSSKAYMCVYICLNAWLSICISLMHSYTFALHATLGTQIIYMCTLIMCISLALPRILNSSGTSLQEIEYGEVSLIKCEVDRGSPLADIHWLRVNFNEETREMELSEITPDGNPRFKIVENGLEISNVQLSDEGTYRCYVYNIYGTAILDIYAAFKGRSTNVVLFYHES